MEYVKQFKDTAKTLKAATATAAKVKPLTNTLAWAAYDVYAEGKLQDRKALAAIVAKGATYNAFKGVVSKARTVFEHFQGHDSLVMKDGSTVEKAKMREVAMTALYNAIKADAKATDESKSREKEAFEAACEQAEISKDDAKLLSPLEKAALVAQGLDILAEADREARMVDRLEFLAGVQADVAAMTPRERNELMAYICTLPGEDAAEAEAA